MKNNTTSLQSNIARTILPAITVIISTTLLWKHQVLHCIYPLIALALLCLLGNITIIKKPFLIATAIFTPLTCIIIKQKVKATTEYQFLTNRPVELSGTVKSVRPSFDQNISTLCTANINYIIHNDKKYYISKKLHIFLPPKTYAKAGQKIYFKNIKIKPLPKGSYKFFCLQNNIWGIIHAKNKEFSLHHTPESKQFSLFDSIARTLSLKTKILFNLIFLGKKDKGYISQNIQHQSFYWGVSHIIARSGMHLSIIFLLVFCVLLALPFSYQHKVLATLLFIALFFIHTPHSTSFNRAFFMIAVYLLSQIHNVIPNNLHILGILALLTLLHNPFHSLSLGFQLSFGVTYIIIKALSNNAHQKHCFKK